MAVKSIVSAEEFDALAEPLKEAYKQDGDNYVLDTDGNDRIREFRNNNIKYLKELEEVKNRLAQFDGIDVEEYKKAQAELQEIKDKELIDAGKIEELIGQRTERMRQDYERRFEIAQKGMEDAKGRAQRFEDELADLKISSLIMDAINKAGRPKAGALPDIMSRARHTWRLDKDGNPVPMSNGQIQYGADANPLTVQDYVLSLMKEAPHLFEENQGSGAPGSDLHESSGGGTVLKNPDPRAFGSRLEDIASGKVRVIR